MSKDAFPQQHQEQPGLVSDMIPKPDHGEKSYVGCGRLKGRKALITGGDSGIGRAVAIAFAREGADIAINYLPEEQEDAEATSRLVLETGQKCLLIPGDIREESFCFSLVNQVVNAYSGIDILVNNAGYQESRSGIADLSTEEFDKVMKTNLYSMFWVTKAVSKILQPGASIINSASIQSFDPSDELLDYATSKAAIVGFTKALSKEMAKRDIRVNAVAPGPIWTPLIPATDWPEKLKTFGRDTPMGRAGDAYEVAGAYVFLAASNESSYITGEVIGVTGGKRVS